MKHTSRSLGKARRKILYNLYEKHHKTKALLPTQNMITATELLQLYGWSSWNVVMPQYSCWYEEKYAPHTNIGMR